MRSEKLEGGAKAAGEWVRIADITPWEQNPRLNEAAIEPVARSIHRFGFGAPVLIRREGMGLIAGHTRLLAMAWLDEKVLTDKGTWRKRRPKDGSFRLVDAPETGFVPARVLDLSEQEAHALALADNRLGELAEWDDEKLASVLHDLADRGTGLDDLGWSADDLKGLLEPAGEDTTYTSKIVPPIYTPKGERPAVTELFDRTKTERLLAEIDAAKNLPPEVDAFLRLAAERHTGFIFSNIAEFYCHADAATQRLFENSGLVIIDFGRALENGFVKLTKRLGELADLEAEAAERGEGPTETDAPGGDRRGSWKA